MRTVMTLLAELSTAAKEGSAILIIGTVVSVVGWAVYFWRTRRNR
jgi:hypothetical protein